MVNTFPIERPVLVRALTTSEQEVLQQHGCELRIYPNAEHPFGHMITFPAGVQITMISSTYAILHFPDGYRPILIFAQGWYSLCQDGIG